MESLSEGVGWVLWSWQERRDPTSAKHLLCASHPGHSVLPITFLSLPNVGVTQSPHLTPKETEAVRDWVTCLRIHHRDAQTWLLPQAARCPMPGTQAQHPWGGHFLCHVYLNDAPTVGRASPRSRGSLRAPDGKLKPPWVISGDWGAYSVPQIPSSVFLPPCHILVSTGSRVHG